MGFSPSISEQNRKQKIGESSVFFLACSLRVMQRQCKASVVYGGGACAKPQDSTPMYSYSLLGGEPHPNHSTIRAPAPTGRVPSNLHACHSPCNVLEVDQRQHQVEYVPLFLLLIFGLSSVVTLAETGRAMIPTGADLPRQDHILWRSRAMCVCTKDAET